MTDEEQDFDSWTHEDFPVQFTHGVEMMNDSEIHDEAEAPPRRPRKWSRSAKQAGIV